MKLIKFEKTDCPPCIAVSNFLDDQGVDYERVNTEENPERAIQHMVMSTPVILLVDDNEDVVERSRGFNPAELENMISKL
ncbi:glutaredoxin family protein [Bacillus sp. AG4(2022)]|uniref:glutaredoxin family protein n=1 Tax=Bacillus sp. AG4(2022) TaxID=2962594 RepID=UPI002881587B|nr:glutaredoxin family protein [Bacillus sp. AG4(2022)]MDT0160466.1 glutaredoxin family protein [Bacillus sp. AG4(2022)]